LVSICNKTDILSTLKLGEYHEKYDDLDWTPTPCEEVKITGDGECITDVTIFYGNEYSNDRSQKNVVGIGYNTSLSNSGFVGVAVPD
jgi:hypothetical protein